MTSLIRALAQATLVEVEAVLSRTSLTGTAIDVSAYEGSALFVLAAGAATAGTDPTLDVKLQHSDASAGTYTDITGGAFSQITDTAGVEGIALDLNGVKKYVKVVATFGGTATPTFPFGVQLLAMKKYS